MSERVCIWLGALCGIAIVALAVMVGPQIFAESARAARPFGGVALRRLIGIVIAFAAYAARVRSPARPWTALVSGRASSRARR